MSGVTRVIFAVSRHIAVYICCLLEAITLSALIQWTHLTNLSLMGHPRDGCNTSDICFIETYGCIYRCCLLEAITLSALIQWTHLTNLSLMGHPRVGC